MVGRLFSVALMGIVGAVAISLVIPVILAVSLTKPVPPEEAAFLPGQIERVWLLLVVPILMYLTGAVTAFLARKHVTGLIDCSLVSAPAGAIAILPGLVLYLSHFTGSSAVLVVVYLIVMLLASVAGGFSYFYVFRIRAKSL